MGQTSETSMEELATKPVYQKEKVFCKDKATSETYVCWQPGILIMAKTVDGDVKVNPGDWMVVKTDELDSAELIGGIVTWVFTDDQFNERFELVVKGGEA